MHRVRFECFEDGKTEPVFDHVSFHDPDAKEFWKLDKYGRHLHILRRMPLVWKTALINVFLHDLDGKLTVQELFSPS